MYCLTCFYDLRGLPQPRCPECGRIFSPINPASYSTAPRPERFYKLVKQASGLLSDALNAVDTSDPLSRVVAPLRRQVARLATENADLRQHLSAITQLLLDRNIIDPADWTAALEQAGKTADVQVIDDTVSALHDEIDPAPTEELLALHRAVKDVRH